jgi:hypothetical protein
MERYERSFELPGIFRTIESRRCEFAQGLRSRTNYVVVATSRKQQYAAFFDLLHASPADTVHLLVQSAYVLRAEKAAPGKGRIHFHALLGHVLRGTTPRRPPWSDGFRGPEKQNPARGGVLP